MRIALVGDIHMYRLWVPPWKLVGKALLGQTNLWLNRRLHFRRHLLPGVVARVRETAPELLLLSGDVSTTAREGEFRAVAEQLDPLLAAIPAVLVPGNHDRYTFSSRRARRVESAFPSLVPAALPEARHLTGDWHLVAVDASVPRAWTSRGEIGRDQLEALGEVLQGFKRGDGVVVLCHYPFDTPPDLPRMRWHHQLADAMPLQRMLAGCRARVLYLHGHVHLPWFWAPTPLPHLTDVNAGAPCLVSPLYPAGQGFWEFELPAHADGTVGWRHHAPLGEAGPGEELRWRVARGPWTGPTAQSPPSPAGPNVPE